MRIFTCEMLQFHIKFNMKFYVNFPKGYSSNLLHLPPVLKTYFTILLIDVA